MPVPRYRTCGHPACPWCHGTLREVSPEDRLDARENAGRKFFKTLGFLLIGASLAVILALFAMVLFGTPARGQTLPTTAPATRPAVNFPKGIVSAWYYSPIENLATVKARGCNAVVGPELGSPPRVTIKQYCDEAARLGLGVIGDKKLLVAGYVPANLIAWICDDEPNSANHNVSPELVRLQALQFRELKPDVPVVLTLAGDKLTSAGDRDFDLYARYVAAVDVVWADWYPKNRQADRYPLTFKRDELVFLKARGAKVLGSVVETSWQKLNKADARGRGPSPDEYEQEVNLAMGAGATWLVHFSTAEFGYPWPLAYDPTPADVVARVTAVNARLNPPVVVPPLPDVLTAKVDALERRAARAEAALADVSDVIHRLREALQPATRPATQPSP